MIESYLEDIILSISESSCIESFEVIKKKVTSTDGYLRLKANLINQDLLEISVYCQKKLTTVELIDYRYHWQDESEVLKMRWDSCPHHKDIKNFPFHVHLNDLTVSSSEKMEVYKILEFIEKNIKGQTDMRSPKNPD